MTYRLRAGTATLVRDAPDADPRALFAESLTVLQELRDLVDPLAVNLWPAARPAAEPYLDPALAVGRPAWHLRRADPPPGVRVAPPSGRPFDVMTSRRLEREDLLGFFDAALDQPAPAPGSVVTWQTWICEAQRAHLLVQPEGGDDVVLLDEGFVVLTGHLIRDDGDGDGAWVGFPPATVDVAPPVRIRVDNDGDALTAELWVSWTPWCLRGSPEAEALSAALARLAGRGWRPTKLEGSLDPGPPATPRRPRR